MIPPPVHARPPSQERQGSIRAQEGDDDARDDHAWIGLKGDWVEAVV
jgi:hypothetical protein